MKHFLKKNFKYKDLEEINKEFNCFTYINKNEIFEQSKTFALKDNMFVKGLNITCASNYLVKKEYKAPFSCTIYNLLLRNNFQFAALTNMDEFAVGSLNESSCYGSSFTLKNSKKTLAGGSSGGSGTAANFLAFTIGTDTGGSSRTPALFNNKVYGFKPSYGKISRYGIFEYAPSLDSPGIFSTSLETIKNIFSILNTYDENDPTMIDFKKEIILDEIIDKRSFINTDIYNFFDFIEFDEETIRNTQKIITSVEMFSSMNKYRDKDYELFGNLLKEKIKDGKLLVDKYHMAEKIRNQLYERIKNINKILVVHVPKNIEIINELVRIETILSISNLTRSPSLVIPTKEGGHSILLGCKDSDHSLIRAGDFFSV